MKYLVLIGDGMADFPLESLDGKTPLDAARTPAMDELAREGQTALFSPIPDSYPAGSDIGNLSLFGYNPDETFTGRAPLEAINQGIELATDEVVFRCNLVTLDQTKMVDFTSGHIGTEEAAELIAALNTSIGNDDLRFHPGVSYRHLMTLKVESELLDDLTNLTCTPPHDIIDREYDAYLPSGRGREIPIQLMKRSQTYLTDHPINLSRKEAGLAPATSIWLWGQGIAPTLPSYLEQYGLTGAVISAVDIVNGIGRGAGLDVITVPGATGYLDTDYEGKVAAALTALDTVDFVYLHVEAPDEASHEGKTNLKIQAIEDFDSRVVAPCLRWAKKWGGSRVLVAPDHITSIESRTHAGGPVPYALWGAGVQTNNRARYCEEEAAKAGLLFPKGYQLVSSMIQTEVLA